MAKKRYGGYKGRVGTRRRTRVRNRAYGGSPKTSGRAKGMAHDWTVGRWR